MSTGDIALAVRGLSKAYSISAGKRQTTTLAETLVNRLRHPFHRARRETFWALDDVSFEVCRGEVVGIIGRNGAGKSTLLKILSRITDPTRGEVDLHGRVGSLLEVGTGFHAELTGRENIYLNGAILGMKRAEIGRRFDEIVEFAGVEQFLNTPVKHYSSGMYVRLAFAVAAHLEPEILLVDEVLAVGDLQFQEKCLGRIRDVAGSGRTVLFVSHNLQTVSLLCNKGLVLRGGRVVFSGDSHGAVDAYLRDLEATRLAGDENSDARPGSGEYRFVSAEPCKALFHGGDEKGVVFRVQRRRAGLSRFYLSGLLVDANGHTLGQFDSRLHGLTLPEAESFEGRLAFRTPWLKPGTYRVDLYICSLGSSPIVDKWENACTVYVSPLTPYAFPVPADAIALGTVLTDFRWEVETVGQLQGIAAGTEMDRRRE